MLAWIKLMFSIYIIFYLIFFYIQVVYSLHSNLSKGANGHKYFILNPIQYNDFVLNIIKNSEEISSENSFRKSDNLNQIISSQIKNIICKESDLVFSNTETNVSHSTILNLTTSDSKTNGNSDYLLLFGADRCILDSSFIDGKFTKINIRFIPNLVNPTKEVYQDKICDCVFKKGNADEGSPSEFQVNCNSDSSNDSNKKVLEEHDYLEIGGATALNIADLVNLPTPIIDKNSQVGREVKVEVSNKTPLKPIIKPNHIKASKPKVNKFNFSKYFWETNSGFFGEGEEAIKKSNIEYCESHGQSKSCEDEERSRIEREFREGCNSKEHQLILETLLIIVNKLVEYLDNK
ncbi:unnamed protein product [Cryptosporidium hominis]|uniref:Uncharacterized protein n=1 Tax=Cryptosporidium hominis TaxID=237895 RepID=A0A0S4TB78_CRYHO|nr:hypothetical protein ChTU502y2012_420g0160 [Cryptosporidium hominis]PPA62373.1 hypothetical protein ChUKH1_13715 [Cryptosporidium hominis]PPS96676.1 Uncharacterized protein GY17_00003467 [Cryptosporidium hominis]CUV04461.1 unnamed protein product [Cryptosporidium hominis]|eukprot:PPS96676.1 Uncharacterized protein GY17_00003467 [Cryptosporidium hominis]